MNTFGRSYETLRERETKNFIQKEKLNKKNEKVDNKEFHFYYLDMKINQFQMVRFSWYMKVWENALSLSSIHIVALDEILNFFHR